MFEKAPEAAPDEAAPDEAAPDEAAPDEEAPAGRGGAGRGGGRGSIERRVLAREAAGGREGCRSEGALGGLPLLIEQIAV